MKKFVFTLVFALCVLASFIPASVDASGEYQSYWLKSLPYGQSVSLVDYKSNRTTNPGYRILTGLAMAGYDITWNTGISTAQQFMRDQQLPVRSQKMTAQAIQSLDMLLLSLEEETMNDAEAAIALFPNTQFTFSPECEHEPMFYYLAQLAHIGDAFPERYRNSLQDMTFSCEINGPRGWGGNNTIIINTAHLMNAAKFQGLFVHEMGHVSSDTVGASANSAAQATAYSDPIAKITEDNKNLALFELSWIGFNTMRTDAIAADFVSGYAQTNVHEDLAESVAAYVTYGANFKYETASNVVLAAKYDFIKNIFFDGQEFDTGSSTTLPDVYDITGE
jgi:hypothetical protein